jgi:histidine phosphotransferase ChpT
MTHPPSAVTEQPALSALVSARLCHDLISPMGAIGNGLELLQMGDRTASAELDLISDSLATALAKLRFYRLAFGPVDTEARQTFEEAQAITDAMFKSRFAITWDASGPDMARTTAQIVYLAILCLEKSLPMGGTVRVRATDSAITLGIEGRRTAPPMDLWDHVTTGAPLSDLRSDGVQFAVFRLVLGATGHRIAVAFSETGAALTMTAMDPLPA